MSYGQLNTGICVSIDIVFLSGKYDVDEIVERFVTDIGLK